MTGDWNAVDEMSEDLNKDLNTVQEVVVKMRELREKTLLERPDDELKQDEKVFARS